MGVPFFELLRVKFEKKIFEIYSYNISMRRCKQLAHAFKNKKVQVSIDR